MSDTKKPMMVCAACGRVEGEHAGWDESCMLNRVEVDPTTVVRSRGDSGRVVRASAIRPEDS